MIRKIKIKVIPFVFLALACCSTPAISSLVYSDTNATGDFWARPFQNGLGISTFGPVQYHVQSFFTADSGLFNFSSIQDYDGFIHLYEFDFSPTDQIVNLLVSDDDGADGIGSSEFSFNLVGSQQYYLVTSAFSAGDVGSFTNTISGNDSDIAVFAGTVSVPEPSTLAILALGVAGLASRRLKK
ncbi:PEP-CTERM sorting domain-containing protein [Aliiglaciecola sp. 3_MG-2023]|uniref:PEP-CTERM sorting domain-containing protein n=1 Tax=Aliiglaciecola sp. 3_MG-2023 TaxID=3062644 RepID=UPI0026E44A7F|nr:PEP-CTERM sorting domain-containing protein [Aliiglaciecola sp. 3_MG-2023]MDO6695719.1 PEP-CTERM sorting domain-containing protein [Aliiglaciecola sp. 3_MG-2023]